MTPHELTTVPVPSRISNGDRTLHVIHKHDAGSAGGVLFAVADPDSFGVSIGYEPPKGTHLVRRYTDETIWTIWTKSPELRHMDNAVIVSAINAAHWSVVE